MDIHNYKTYAAIDAAVTFRVLRCIEQDFVEWGHEATGLQMQRLYPVLLYMQTRGIKVDRATLDQMAEETKRQISDLQIKLNLEVGHELNANSPKQCADYFYGQLRNAPYTKAGGGVTTDDTAMARLARRGIYAASLVQQIRGARKLLSTYLEVVLDSDGRMRSSYNPRGTTTGRLSSSKTIFGTGLNSQNIDPRFKRFCVADDECLLFELDKSQAEWVIVAYASGNPRMLEILEQGKDPHVMTGHLITGVPEELIREEETLVGTETDEVEIHEIRKTKLPSIFKHSKFLPRSMSCRQAGKKSNHALNYIMGYRRFALVNEIPEGEAKVMVDLYHDAYNLDNWWGKVENQLKLDRTISNCFGRNRRFLGPLDEDTLKAAVAFIPQSTVGDLVNRGLITIYESGEHDRLMDLVDLVFQIHDSILFQLPIGGEAASAVHQCVEALNETMVYNAREFTIATEGKAGFNWGKQSEDNSLGMRKLKQLGKPGLQREIEGLWQSGAHTMKSSSSNGGSSNHSQLMKSSSG